MYRRRRVVVTGMGTINPLGKSLDEYWTGLVEGRSVAAAAESYCTDNLGTKIACEVKGFDPFDHMNRRIAYANGRFTQFAVAATGMAIQDGTNGNWLLADDKLFVRYLATMAAAQTSISFGLKGPGRTINAACASGNAAIMEATRAIEWGLADVMVLRVQRHACVHGQSLPSTRFGALSRRNDDPATASRPFDKGRDGFVPGEGAGALILESLEHARRRGARIYGEVAGSAVTSDAVNEVAPDATGTSQAECILKALQDAGLASADLDYEYRSVRLCCRECGEVTWSEFPEGIKAPVEYGPRVG